MDAVVGIDADQVGVESGMMNFGQGEPIADYWLTQEIIPIRHDVGSI